MNRIIRTYDFRQPAAELQRLWDRLEYNAELRGDIDAAFEPLPGGGTRMRVATAWEADGERRIDHAVAQFRQALEH